MIKRNVTQHVLLGLIGLGVWLPIIVFAVLVYVLKTSSELAGAAVAVGSTIGLIVSAEIAAGLILFIYACWAKPWRRSSTLRTEFYVHTAAAGVSLLTVVIFVATI
ncbi:hypothetical protein ALQ33_04076 [Pseudomonas syringae pv. philadelphi]|uniref:Uncharacterized protein n=1 Tax=Pseudomonas syringae pv. philadelphi TaxID=251706 RepID=A0A3M3YX92_9PSED|nr:hypothetical protein [Pseudomonas syringae group genomosp. 3]RMO86906.1 hypothetical protein ALQ33_04076 [Pseudomonas syringae pv. philadelphi]